jgi:hypothetical protein
VEKLLVSLWTDGGTPHGRQARTVCPFFGQRKRCKIRNISGATARRTETGALVFSPIL